MSSANVVGRSSAPSAYSSRRASQQLLGELRHRTPAEALEAGVPPKEIWAAVWHNLGLPASAR